MRPAFGTAIVVTVLSAVLFAPSLAHASPQFSVSFLYEFTTDMSAAPTGAHVLVVYSDPGEPNQKPKVARRVTIVYPRGTIIDHSALPQCGATDAELMQDGRDACPADTQLGVGQTEVTSGTGPPLELDQYTFNAAGNFILIFTLKGTNTVVNVVHETTSGRVARTVNQPSCVPPGQPPDCAFGEYAVTRFEAFDPPAGIPVTASTITTPPTCRRTGFWPLKMKFVFSDGTTASRLSYAPCRRAKAPSKHR